MMSPTFDSGFTTPEMAEIWTATNRAGAILAFEAALARGLAEVGLAPGEQAEAVATACAKPLRDPEATLASTWESGSPLIAIVEEIKARLNHEQGAWVHFGATTQDAIDTAHMVLAGSALESLEESLVRAAGPMLELMNAHRTQPQIGRTFLQHAHPTTFGMRVAFWLEPTLRHIEDLRLIRKNLAVQLGGPVGNRAAFGSRSDELVRAVAIQLGLQSPLLSWHTDRSRIWKVVNAVELAVMSSAKIAFDIALLAQSDIDEVVVRAGGSSSMTEKRNPLDAIRALAAADACRGAASIITLARPHELDRGVGSWHVEWFALPLVFHTAAATFEALERLMATLAVRAESMDSRVPFEDRPPEEVVERQIESVVSLYDRVVGP